MSDPPREAARKRAARRLVVQRPLIEECHRLTILDARNLDREATLSADVCVVGAGAAGITLATELSRFSRDVCLIESGGFAPDEETQSLYDLENRGYPIRDNYMSRARYYGGSCNIWAGRCMKLQRFDVQPRPWVPESGWPIPYSELEAHYPRAEEILRLPSDRFFSESAYRDRIADREKALFAYEEFDPTVSLWAKSAIRFGSAYRKQLRRSANVRLVLNANVTQIRLNEAGNAVDSLRAMTFAGHKLTVTARVFVIACGGLENARLLLVSRDRHENGVGNRFDLVGRYFMDHPRAVFGKVRLNRDCRLPLLRGFPFPDGKVQFGIGLGEATQEREGLLNHYVTLESQVSGYAEEKYQSLVNTAKIVMRKGYAGSRLNLARGNLADIPDLIYLLSPKELLPHFMYRWYARARDIAVRRRKEQTCVLVYFCEQPPNRDSRVYLGASRDRFGLNRLVLDWRIGNEVRDSVMRLQTLLRRRLEEAGIGSLENDSDELNFTDASHHMGVTRMGDSPRTGVVDRDCKVHGVANLFVAGSSVFPSAGHANPTLTIVALAVRLANHLRGLSDN